MNEKKYPYSDSEFKKRNRLNIIFNASIYLFLSINASVYYLHFIEERNVLVFAIICLCLVPISIFDPLKGNNNLVSNLLNGVLYIVVSIYGILNSGDEPIVIMTVFETCVLLIEVYFLTIKKQGASMLFALKTHRKSTTKHDLI